VFYTFADATLKFAVELVSIGVKPQKKHPYFFSSDDVFSEIDKDGDLLLDFSEMIEYLAKNKIVGRHKSIYEAEDTDKDGIVTLKEFTGPKKAHPFIIETPAGGRKLGTGKQKESEEVFPRGQNEITVNGEVLKVDIGWT
jgi:hypothetical protein